MLESQKNIEVGSYIKYQCVGPGSGVGAGALGGEAVEKEVFFPLIF